METRGPYRRHAPQFKLRLCQEIRSGALGRREAGKKYSLSDNLIQLWLARYDRDQLDAKTVDAAVLVAYEAKIAALERKVGQLTMALDGASQPLEPNGAAVLSKPPIKLVGDLSDSSAS